MKHGGPRPGAGRPKQRTVLEVALSLSAPAAWEASVPEARVDETPVIARYRPSKASVVRSSIPAAAIRRQEIDNNAGRARRSLFELEHELVERTHASTANDTTTGAYRSDKSSGDRGEPSSRFRRTPCEVGDGFESGVLHSISSPQLKGRNEVGSSMNDFLYERFYDGTMQPSEIRGLKWVR